MTLTHEQYERIGRFLDGEPVSLTQAELAAAEEFREDEAHVSGMLSVSAPAPAAAIEAAVRQVLVAQVRQDEAALAAVLDAPVPAGTYQRVHRRVVAELARPRRRLLRIAAAAASVAAAAVIVLTVASWQSGPGPDTSGGGVVKAPALPEVPVEVISASVQQPHDVAVDLLADEIDRFEADMVAATPSKALDLRIDEVEQALEDFWLDPEEAFE